MRAATRQAHARLDEQMSALGWDDLHTYASFLEVQLAARWPIEQWITRECPQALRPPRQSHLIVADLASLDIVALSTADRFRLPAGADPIGVVWTLAGSALGNGAIARSIKQAPNAASFPLRFFTDCTMLSYWKALLPQVERAPGPGEAAAAAKGALAVFDHFQRIAATMSERRAA